MTGFSDSFQRPINYLRVSVTDRCNLRCIYCMPSTGIKLMSHEDVLSYEEIYKIIAAAASLGINKIRLTGGEPLARLGLPGLIQMIANTSTIDDIAMTTNGILLSRYAAELKEAGLKRVNISLDTLKPDRFEKITRGGKLSNVLEGIETAISVGLNPVKINMVVMAGVNDDEVIDFALKTSSDGWNVRYIELMPVTNKGVKKPKFISANDIKKRLEALGPLEPYKPEVGNGPAKYFKLPKAAGTIGFITPVSEHFCLSCNRLRLTADGKLRPCLMSSEEIDLRQSLRSGASQADLEKLIKQAISKKPLQHHLSDGYILEDRPFSQVGG